MRRFIAVVLLFALYFCAAPALLADPDLHDTKLLSSPAVSAKHVAFVYADDLWVADLGGNNVRRLTTDIGAESNPVFSPDGNTIAFTAQYDGNSDVYTIPVVGGAPTRLTWHPGPDIVRGWTPDGKAVLFSSPRHVFTNRYTQLFTVPTTGGMPTQLPIPNGVEACYSPDGQYIAHTPLGDRTQQWKHYRGGTNSRIWIYRCKDHAVEQIPQPVERCNDLDPHWIGDTVFFRSDRNGEYNLFSYDTKGKTVAQLTQHNDFPVQDIGSGGGRLIYEQAGHLHLVDPSLALRASVNGSTASNRLKIGVASDLVDARPRYVKGGKFIRNGSISPSGARAVFEFRGEIVTVPAAKGDARNLTNTVGVHERSPAWSPDAKSIAYFSDEGGEYQLHIRSTDSKSPVKSFQIQGGAGFYDNPVWSPDSKKIAFLDNSQSLLLIDLDNGAVKKVASEPQYGPTGLRTLRPAWSPDSRWLAYTLGNRAAYHTVYAYDVAAGKATAVTDGLSDALDPVFDAGGKYLYFLASTDAGPSNQWFAQSNADMKVQRSIYLAVLKKGTPSPLARESDEEKPKAEEKKELAKGKGKEKDKDKEKTKTETVVIDFEGLSQRILALPVPPGNYSSLQAGLANQIYYLERGAGSGLEAVQRGGLQRFDLTKRKSEPVLPGAAAYDLSADGKKALVASAGAPSGPPDPFSGPSLTWSIIELGTPAAAGPPKGKLNTDAIEVRIDPRAEWQQIFDEAWRINRDYFYDPGMHGCDWPAMKKKYAAFLPHLATRSDLDRVIRGMLSELAVGHSYLNPGERLHERKPVPGGLLGADYEIADGRYRFKKVYGGLNWSPEARAPLTVPGVEVKAGEYLLAVRGIDLKPPTELYSLFENTANKSIEITVGPSADGKGSRTVTVEPLANEGGLRNRDWVEGNLQKVHKATGGRVAYVYVPNTANPGHAYFKRYFFPQSDKDAIIIDERFNGGGQVADYYIDHLRRPFTAMWATRYGEDIRTPGAAILGPKVMLIDETAGSGGDLLPWMFRQNKLGPLVGKRTWGGLVGILGFPPLMDGGGITAPNLAFWTKEEGFGVENVGVPPDVEVEQLPADVIAGRDPQLERAIAIVLAELEKSPPVRHQRPPFPIRVKR
ncbi:MAG: PDZ domain-containing protein [Gemmataceae bacterium]|nr:PDZ domain-containing protein [Gemmataceae bacterium]MCI0738859.1 PDZ domain-containing protein [Gemmataceae bacterium]